MIKFVASIKTSWHSKDVYIYTYDVKLNCLISILYECETVMLG